MSDVNTKEETISSHNQYSNVALSDSEIIKCVSGSVNPFTGEIISGVDDMLKARVKDISSKLDNLIIDLNNCKDIKKLKTARSEKFPMAWEK